MHRWASEEVEYVYVCVDGCAEVNDCAAELAASLLRIRAEKSLRQSSYLQQQRAEESAAPRGGGAVVIGMLMHCVYGQMVKSYIKSAFILTVLLKQWMHRPMQRPPLPLWIPQRPRRHTVLAVCMNEPILIRSDTV